jgi:hypothetical protein
MPSCAIELSATSTLNSTNNPVANVFILLPQAHLNLRTIAPAGPAIESRHRKGDPGHCLSVAASLPQSRAHWNGLHSPDDEVFLLSAIDGNADYLVSDDHHLTELKSSYAKPVIGMSGELAGPLGANT